MVRKRVRLDGRKGGGIEELVVIGKKKNSSFSFDWGRGEGRASFYGEGKEGLHTHLRIPKPREWKGTKYGHIS